MGFGGEGRKSKTISGPMLSERKHQFPTQVDKGLFLDPWGQHPALGALAGEKDLVAMVFWWLSLAHGNVCLFQLYILSHAGSKLWA